MREIKYEAWNGYKMFSWQELLQENLIDVFKQVGWRLRQYTGLKDKNGKEIYEGDIVSYVNDASDIWGDLSQETIVMEMQPNISPQKISVGGPDGYEEYKDFQVLGNIYENPELLK